MNDMDAKGGGPRSLFERSVQRLDPATGNRLRLARRAALADASRATARARGWPAALAATAVLVLGVAWWLPRGEVAAPTPAPVTVAAEDPVLVADGDEAELYAWLAEAPVAAEPEAERSL